MKSEALTLQRFLELLRASRLLSAESLARVDQLVTREDYQDPGPVAWWLVEQDLVTRWQAHVLVSGRNRFLLGKYKLLDRIGVGGMGTVYKAWQSGLAREVALKVLSDALVGNELAAARFHREIQSAAALTHPNIVTTFDADCVAGKHFLVMEYVDGENLEALSRRRGPLPVAEACEYIRQAAVGLAHAHEQGMIHRDIKPANLLLSRASGNGQPRPGAGAAEDAPLPVVKILDFGLARLTTEKHGDTELTQAGQVMGTPDYIAPEQARDTRLADFRSDIYSLGCALFRLLTGRVPFIRASVMEKLMARALEDAPRARSLRPDLPPQLDECIARMLERDPGRRYQSAAEVAQALDALAASAANVPLAAPLGAGSAAAALSEAAALYNPISAPDADLEQFLAVLSDQADSDGGLGGLSGDTTRAAIAAGATRIDPARQPPFSPKRDVRRRSGATQQISARGRRYARMPLVITAAALVPVTALLLWYISGGTRLDVDWPIGERKGGTLEIDGREPVLSGKLSFSGRPGKRKLKLKRTGYHPIEDEVVLARGAVVTYRPEWVPTPQTARKQEWSALKAEAEPWQSTEKKAGPSDSRGLDAVRSRVDEFRRRWLTTREAEQAEALLRRLRAPADRLDHLLIPEYERRIAGAGAAATAPRELVAVIGDSRWKQGSPTFAIAYSPLDDSLLATAESSGFLKFWNARTGEETTAAKPAENAIMCLAFSPDGKSVVTGGADSRVRIWNVATHTVERILDGHFNQIRGVAYSPRGDLFVTGGIDQTLQIWNAADGSLVRDIRDGVGQVNCLAFSPDEKLVAVGQEAPRSLALFDITSGKLVANLEGHTNTLLSVAFNRDGTRLISTGYEAVVRCWDVAARKELFSKAVGENRYGAAAVRYSPDDTLIAVGIGDGDVELRDPQSLALLRRLKSHEPGLATLSFSHDGKRLAAAGGGSSICVWDVATGTRLNETPPAVLSLASSPDCRWLALGMPDGKVDLWDLAAGRTQATLSGNARRAGELAFSPDGLLLATAGDPADATVRVWDIKANDVKHVLQGHRAYAAGMAFSPDAQTLATTSHDGAVRLWNMESGALVRTLESKGAPPICATFSPDGKTLAVGHVRDGATNAALIRLWDVDRGKEQKPVSLDWNDVTGLAYGRDEQLLVAGYRHQGVKLWDLSRGSARSTFYGPATFAVSPDGLHVAVDEKTAINVYEIAHGIRAAELSLGRADVWSQQLTYTADGRHLAVLASNGLVYVLRLPKDDPR